MPHLNKNILNTSRFSVFLLEKEIGPSFWNLMKGCKFQIPMAIRPTFWRFEVDKNNDHSIDLKSGAPDKPPIVASTLANFGRNRFSSCLEK